MRHKYFLDWPHKHLKVNGTQPHWSKKAAAKKKAKADSYHLALASGLGKIDAELVTVNLTFYPPSRRHFDADNLVASHKSAIDGLSMAIGIDDSKFRVSGEMAGTIEKNGLVKVELEW